MSSDPEQVEQRRLRVKMAIERIRSADKMLREAQEYLEEEKAELLGPIRHDLNKVETKIIKVLETFPIKVGPY